MQVTLRGPKNHHHRCLCSDQRLMVDSSAFQLSTVYLIFIKYCLVENEQSVTLAYDFTTTISLEHDNINAE